MKQFVIFDTDMDTDCDDVGALAMLLEAHKQGMIELVGIISDSVCKFAAPCCEAISNFYGVDVPIGAIYADDYSDTENNINRFAAYRKHTVTCSDNGRGYNRIFSEKIKKTDLDYPSAAYVYRKILANAEDESVTVLCVGMLTAIYEALKSEPDSISCMTGVELFERKVKKVITMGNPDKIDDFNWGMDAYASEKFFAMCPVPIYISAEGDDVITGDILTKTLHSDHLLRCAYETWLKKENCGRASWDLIASLFAINPDVKHLILSGNKEYRYSADDKKLFVIDEGKGNHRTIHVNCSKNIMVEILNSCMLGIFDEIE